MDLKGLLPDSELQDFEASLSCYGDRCIRVHARRNDVDLPFQTKPVPWFEDGRFLTDSQIRPANSLNYAIGDYYIQDAASLLPLAMLNLQGDEHVCDLCAAPGGKASAIAERLDQNGFLLANESIRSRVDVLKASLARTGNPTYAVSWLDPMELTSHVPQSFDVVLVDAPCSGQTLVGKNKRDDNAFSDHQIEHSALRQRRILLSAIQLLKPGGRLLYSTCTFSIEENEAQIQWLQDRFENAWKPIVLPSLSQWESPLAAGCYRLWPHRDRCSGGFAASLQLNADLATHPFLQEAEPRMRERNSRNQAKSLRSKQSSKARNSIDPMTAFGVFSDMEHRWDGNHGLSMTPKMADMKRQHPDLPIEPLLTAIQVGNHCVPTQGLAMLDRNWFRPHATLELSDEQAVAFMAGGAIPNSDFVQSHRESRLEFEQGWTVATWRGSPLGWCKLAGNRYNNHLPPWARLQIV